MISTKRALQLCACMAFISFSSERHYGQVYIDQFTTSQTQIQLLPGSGILSAFNDVAFLGGTRRIEITRAVDTNLLSMSISSLGNNAILAEGFVSNAISDYSLIYTPGAAFDFSSSPVLRVVGGYDDPCEVTLTLFDGVQTQSVTLNMLGLGGLENSDFQLSSFNLIDLSSVDSMEVRFFAPNNIAFDGAIMSISTIPEPSTCVLLAIGAFLLIFSRCRKTRLAPAPVRVKFR